MSCLQKGLYVAKGMTVVCSKSSNVPMSFEWSALSGEISQFKCFWYYFSITSTEGVPPELNVPAGGYTVLTYNFRLPATLFKKKKKQGTNRASQNKNKSTNEVRDGAVSFSRPPTEKNPSF